MRALVVLVCLTLAAASGCGGAGTDPEAGRTEVTGVILTLDTNASGEITGFVVREREETLDVAVDPARDYGFDLRHLNQHLAQEQPVRCKVEQRDGSLVALTIEDAPSPAG